MEKRIDISFNLSKFAELQYKRDIRDTMKTNIVLFIFIFLFPIGNATSLTFVSMLVKLDAYLENNNQYIEQ